jgi:hypothetical protein
MNRIKGLILLGVLLVTTALPVQAFAQSATTIKYGDIVKGTLTADKATITYTFKTTANDVVVLYMQQDGSDSSVAPVMTITDSQKAVVGDTTKQYTTYSAIFAFQATAGGSYTVVAGTGDAAKLGNFKLLLSKAEVLTVGKAANGHATSDQSAYYVYTSGDPFTVSYSKQAGDFTPTVNVNQISDSFSLKQLAFIGGGLVSAGSLTIKPTAKQMFVLSIEANVFDFITSAVTADFTLQVDIAK